MNNCFNLKIAALMFVVFSKVFAQADAKLSSYFFTPMTYNPAYAGSYEGISLSGVYSSQWVGFEGAPTTILFSGHGTFINSHTGMGLDVINDEIGASKETSVTGNYSYHFNLNSKWKLAMGIKAGVNSYTLDYNLLAIENPEEYSGSSGTVNNMSFNFGTGFYLHDDKFFVGLGIPNILAEKNRNDQVYILSNNNKYYITSGYKFEIDEYISLQPTIMTRLSKGESQSTMFALNSVWSEKFYVSLNFEPSVSVGSFVGVRFLEKYMIGYSYDASINSFSRYNDGSHSFFVNFRLEDFWKRERCSCYSF